MRVLGTCLCFSVAFLMVGGIIGQEPKPGETKAAKADPKVEPKAKGQLPQNWKQLGLTDEQVQKVYKVQGKYNDDIDKLEAQIKELKAKMSKERSEVLTSEQKKRLDEILKGKSGADK